MNATRIILATALALAVLVPASSLFMHQADAADGCSLNGVRYSDGARVGSQKCMDGQWAPRNAESCSYPVIAVSPAGGIEPCTYANQNYPDG